MVLTHSLFPIYDWLFPIGYSLLYGILNTNRRGDGVSTIVKPSGGGARWPGSSGSQGHRDAGVLDNTREVTSDLHGQHK